MATEATVTEVPRKLEHTQPEQDEMGNTRYEGGADRGADKARKAGRREARRIKAQWQRENEARWAASLAGPYGSHGARRALNRDGSVKGA